MFQLTHPYIAGFLAFREVSAYLSTYLPIYYLPISTSLYIYISLRRSSPPSLSYTHTHKRALSFSLFSPSLTHSLTLHAASIVSICAGPALASIDQRLDGDRAGVDTTGVWVTDDGR